MAMGKTWTVDHINVNTDTEKILTRTLTRQDYCVNTAPKISVDMDTTPNLLLLIQQKLRIVQYRSVVFPLTLTLT